MKTVLLTLLLAACARPPNWMREPPEEKVIRVKRVDRKTWSAVDHGYHIQVLPGCGPRGGKRVYEVQITPLWYLDFGDVRCPKTLMYPKPEPLGISWDLAR